jgi:hypothetical protein
MNQPTVSPELTVAQVLGASDAIPMVFLQHRTACVGCCLARFCTLRDVAKTYELSLEVFLAELQQFAHANHSNVLGGRDEEPD